MPRIRRDAARLFRSGWSARKIGRYLGYHHTAIMKWVAKAKQLGDMPIRTQSSAPHHHPKQLKKSIVEKIVQKRLEHNRYAEAVHQELKNDGIKVSLSSVKRTIDRAGLLKKRSPWKRYHPHQERPVASQPGDLVELDTIHLMISEKKRIYVFTLIDIYSRWVYARSYPKMSGAISIKFVREAQKKCPFTFKMFQSDHGPEFGKWFVSQIQKNHRYTRIGKPNDNAHIERFNRTLQEECLDNIPLDVHLINCSLRKYLKYYNNHRVHAGINFKIPSQMVPSF